MSYFRSKLDSDQVLSNSHDEATQSIVTKSITDLVGSAWNHMGASYTSTTDVYTFYSGWNGSSGTLLKTITITYTDSTKGSISTVDAV